MADISQCQGFSTILGQKIQLISLLPGLKFQADA
jgi:hypothetical protein